ncbi:MAG: protein kinase, partial [Casimicrobiaceae bacterium]
MARCGCGASLAGVDFSLEPEPVAETAVAATAIVPAAIATVAEIPPATVICPHDDCAQPNPAGNDRCVYCGRPLHELASALPGARPLPAALRDAYRIVEVFPASGSEADLLLVADVASGERRVAKLYRKGVAPDFRLLTILSEAVGHTVVRVLAHGVSEGTAYELLEYVPGGTLGDLIREGPLPKDDIERIVAEIADALNGIHAHRILHRDLKPENVLVRSKSPLALALTDFGIASLTSATQHFTSAARTTKYAAPEALTGVLDDKADWWSLGMIVLEAASGRHPFDGLNEQVMNHHLATKPIDVRGVYDDALRMLCRGLLLRDPKRRWGGAEVARWLAGDTTLTVPDGADGVASAVRPYRVGTTDATTAAELALALAKHWDAARKDLARG